MKGWSLLLFAVAYLGAVTACIWLNLAVLCLGDRKFDGGCGGFELYFPLWVVFSAPLALTALVAAARLAGGRRRAFLALATLIIVALLELAWLVYPDAPHALRSGYIIGGVALLASYLAARFLPSRVRPVA